VSWPSHGWQVANERRIATAAKSWHAAKLAAALGRIDAMIARAMRIRLDHALAADTSIGAPTRSVFASTIVTGGLRAIERHIVAEQVSFA
jgi:hypothetical protein